MVSSSADVLSNLCVSGCRLRPGEGLYNARLHAEAREPLFDSVAASLLLSLPQSCGVEGGGRVTGEPTSQHTHTHTSARFPLLSVHDKEWAFVCLSVLTTH